MTTSPIEELLSLVRRDLGAEEAHVLEPGEEPPSSPSTMAAPLPRGRTLVASFGAPPSDREARERRLGMLAESFRSIIEQGAHSRPPAAPARSLHEELVAVARRAGAVDALVIDAHSPIVWGASDDDASLEHLSPENDVELSGAWRGEDGPTDATAHLAEVAHAEAAGHQPLALAHRSTTVRALEAVRALPELDSLPRGGHMHHTASGDDFGYVAHSFAGIYVLVLAFEGRFDELRAKRAVTHALPAIENLVLALPPLEPGPPIGGAMVVRRGRRR